MTITRKPLPGYEGILELVTETYPCGHQCSRRLRIGAMPPVFGKCLECKRQRSAAQYAQKKADARKAARREEAAKTHAAAMLAGEPSPAEKRILDRCAKEAAKAAEREARRAAREAAAQARRVAADERLKAAAKARLEAYKRRLQADKLARKLVKLPTQGAA